MTTKRSSFHLMGDQISDVSKNNGLYTPEINYNRRTRPTNSVCEDFNLSDQNVHYSDSCSTIELNNNCDSSNFSKRNIHIREISNNCTSPTKCNNLDISNSPESGNVSIKVIGGECDIYNSNLSSDISQRVKCVVIPNRGYQNLDMYSTDNESVECVQAEICKPEPRKIDDIATNNCMFTSMIISLFDLKADKSNRAGLIEFIIKRKDKIITLQWEGFSGKIAGNGTKYIHVAQSIAHLPQYPISKPIITKYNNEYNTSRIEINPYASPYEGIVKFYLYSNGNQENIKHGDNIYIPGSSITWIIE